MATVALAPRLSPQATAGPGPPARFAQLPPLRPVEPDRPSFAHQQEEGRGLTWINRRSK